MTPQHENWTWKVPTFNFAWGSGDHRSSDTEAGIKTVWHTMWELIKHEFWFLTAKLMSDGNDKNKKNYRYTRQKFNLFRQENSIKKWTIELNIKFMMVLELKILEEVKEFGILHIPYLTWNFTRYYQNSSIYYKSKTIKNIQHNVLCHRCGAKMKI